MSRLEAPFHGYDECPILQEAFPEIDAALESGIWPAGYFHALLTPVTEWAARYLADYHHAGYTYPDRFAFEAATRANAGELIANDLTTPTAVHRRRYARKPGTNGRPETFIEYHMVGDDGNGIRGIHFDFITEDAAGMLEYVRAYVEQLSLPETKIVTQPFGGGSAPVGKVELQPLNDPTRSVGVMARTHWSHPIDW